MMTATLQKSRFDADLAPRRSESRGVRVRRILVCAAALAVVQLVFGTPSDPPSGDLRLQSAEEHDEQVWRYETFVSGGRTCARIVRGGDYVGRLTIPESLGGYPVTEIGDAAFNDCYELTSVEIPEGVTRIGRQAFGSCFALASVVLPSTLKQIDNEAFWNDMGLQEVFIPAGVEYIGRGVFATCCHLHVLEVAADNAFYKSVDNALYTKDGTTILHWPTWMHVAIPAGVRNIADHAYRCNIAGMSDTEVEIPAAVTNIGADAFSCRNISTLKLNEGLVNMECGAFQGNRMTQVVVPASVRSIGSMCFALNKELKTIAFMGDEPEYEPNLPNTPCGIAGGYWGEYVENTCVYVRPSARGWRDEAGDIVSLWPRLAQHRCQVKTWDGKLASLADDRVTLPSEVTGGKEIEVPASWVTDELTARFGADRAEKFESMFGSDFAAALLKPTGKRSADGTALCVWQDYVAGTDPTDPESKFTVSILMAGGKPSVTWSPDLNEGGTKSLRAYTVYGARELGGAWVDVKSVPEGEKAGCGFFRVSVSMP